MSAEQGVTPRRILTAVALGYITLAALLLLTPDGGDPPKAHHRSPRAEWDAVATADMAATATSTTYTTTTTAPPVVDASSAPEASDGLHSGIGEAPSNHEDASPPLGGSTAGGTLASIRACESGGDYGYDDGTYHGAYNYDNATWAEAGGSTATADQASPAEQDAVTAAFIASGHRGRWPDC